MVTFHQGEMLYESSKEVDIHHVTFDQKRALSPTNLVVPAATEVPKVVESPKVEVKPKAPVKSVEAQAVKPK